ncbi:hypothetical protein EJB05_48483, partial [Eragrostis curvula]
QSDTSEKSSSSNQPEIPHATNGGARALRPNELDSSVSIYSKQIRADGPSDGPDGSQAKKKRLHRFTSHQSEILEGFFSAVKHPNENERQQLSETTGLSENQVKFWFQNKRTQVKSLKGKEENYRLKAENVILKDENKRLKQAEMTISCPSCSGNSRKLPILQEIERLKSENGWIQQELARLNSELPMNSNAPRRIFQHGSSSGSVVVLQDEQMLAEIARIAVQEFVSFASSSGPMWLSVSGDSLETLNKMAYDWAFPWQNSAMGLKMKTTRANAVVMLDSQNVVGFLMDAESYGTYFPGIMFGATATKVYNWPSDRNAGYDGAMELLMAEVVFPSPLIPAKKCSFLRYCKNLENGATAIIDISVESLPGNFLKCWKMASGLLIQPVTPGSCKVTAIEHVPVEDAGIHDLFKLCLSGLLFGARRWVVSMARQCARIRDVYHVTNSPMGAGRKWRQIILKMADTLLANYSGGIAGIPTEAWTVQCGKGVEEDIKVVYKRNDDGSNTAVVCASASFLLPLPMRRVFDLLKNNLLRVKWDVLIEGGSVKEEVRVGNAVGSDDSISILHVKHGSVGDTKMILQNSSYDASGSFLVYSSLDDQLIDKIMSPGGNQEMGNVRLYPTGFFHVPIADAAQASAAIGEAGRTVMTAGFQIPMKLARGTGLCPRQVSSAIRTMSDRIQNVKDMLPTMRNFVLSYQELIS